MQRCNYEDCKKLIKCEDDTKPCPQDNKWCPACPKPDPSALKCPEVAPCPNTKAVCPKVTCPDQNEHTKCEIINKNVVVNKDLINIINDLSKELESDPAARDKLCEARQLLKNIEIIDPEDLEKKIKLKMRLIHEKYIKDLKNSGYEWNDINVVTDIVVTDIVVTDIVVTDIVVTDIVATRHRGDNHRDNPNNNNNNNHNGNNNVVPTPTIPVTTMNGKIVPDNTAEYSNCPLPSMKVNNNIQ